MDATRFDDLLRTVSAASRRRVLAGLASGLLAILPLSLGDDAAAKKKRKKKKKKPTEAQVTLCVNGKSLTVPESVALSLIAQGATYGACPLPPPPPPSPPPPPPPPFCTASKNVCVVGPNAAQCQASGTACYCRLRADAGHVGEPFCGQQGGFSADSCGPCAAAGRVCTLAGGTCSAASFSCVLPCPNPL
jgi:hypothetical protein